MLSIRKTIPLLISFILFVILFTYFPSIDLSFSRLFYNFDHGFISNNNFIIRLIQTFIIIAICVTTIVVVCEVIFVNYKAFRRGESSFKHSLLNMYYVLLYLSLVAVMGGIVLIHNVTKEVFHRARPFQIEEFGGAAEFSPAWIISDQCSEDCSFVSGHAAKGFALYSLGFLSIGRRRKWLFITATFIGLSFGILRIATGKHFLSDIVFSGFIMFFISWLLHRLILEKQIYPTIITHNP